MNLKRCIFIVALIFALAAKTLAADFVVVVHTENALSWMTEQDIKQIFLGKTSQQFMIYWKKMLFTGKGLLPRSVRTDAEVKAFIASNPDAIGYILPDALDDTVKKLEVH